MEIARSSTNNIDELSNSKIPSAPEFDEESLTNVNNIDNDWQLPERIERSRHYSSSFWNKLKNSFKNYKKTRINNQILENPINNYGSNQIIDSNNFYSNNDNSLINNQENRNLFLRRLYAWLLGQQFIMTLLCALFYYVPHIRKIFRKTFADKIFLR